MIKEVNTIENVLVEVEKVNAQIDKSAKKKRRYVVPEKFLFKESRELFVNPDVTKSDLLDVFFKYELFHPNRSSQKSQVTKN